MSKTVTITEALADLKVNQRKIESKQQFVTEHLTRNASLRDPLERDGGSPKVVSQELQAIADLREQAVAIRHAIAQANETITVTIDGVSRSVADWLRWRRDVAPGERDWYASLVRKVHASRQNASRAGASLVSASATMGDTKPEDVLVHVSEVDLNGSFERINALLETLDGQLSLKNATVTVTY